MERGVLGFINYFNMRVETLSHIAHSCPKTMVFGWNPREKK